MGEQRCVNALQVSVLDIPTVPADRDPPEPSALSALPLPHVSVAWPRPTQHKEEQEDQFWHAAPPPHLATPSSVCL